MSCSSHLTTVPLLLLLLVLLSKSHLAATDSNTPGPVASASAVVDQSDAVAGAPGSSSGGGVPDPTLVSCMTELLPCTAYLRSGQNPSKTCCTAMHDGAVDEMHCLCRLLADPELLRTFNVTRDHMFRLPARCNLPLGCQAGAGGSPEPVVQAPPPPEETGERAGGDSSGGERGMDGCVGGRVIVAAVLGGVATVAALLDVL
uniref:Bifunctional inhibitor/plant lipid transfer protein/seed storage helical domain-containing protein n=1 Tax=Leersia perrieri TaxID=77586 RepID=A0A0D9VHJ6_9ORYZ